MLDHLDHHFMCIFTSCDLVAITSCHMLLHHMCCLCLTYSTWYNSISNLVSLITKTKLGLSPLLIVWPSILNSVINFSIHLWPVKWNALQMYLCLAHFILSPLSLMQHMHQPYHKWYDPLHIIAWPYWFINLDLTCSSPLLLSIDAKSCSSFPATQFIASKPPTCPSRLQSVYQPKPHLDLLHLVTWLNVMSHMQ
jgi:hypothetical protein